MRSPEVKRGRGREEPVFNPFSPGNITNSFPGSRMEPLGFAWEEESDPSSWLPTWSPSSAHPIRQHWQRPGRVLAQRHRRRCGRSPHLGVLPALSLHSLAAAGCGLVLFIPQLGGQGPHPRPALLVLGGPRKGAHFLAPLQPNRLGMGWWIRSSLGLHSLSRQAGQPPGRLLARERGRGGEGKVRQDSRG